MFLCWPRKDQRVISSEAGLSVAGCLHAIRWIPNRFFSTMLLSQWLLKCFTRIFISISWVYKIIYFSPSFAVFIFEKHYVSRACMLCWGWACWCSVQNCFQLPTEKLAIFALFHPVNFAKYLSDLMKRWKKGIFYTKEMNTALETSPITVYN